MYSWKKRMAVCVLLMASFVVFLPISVNAYQVHLTSYESELGSTGRIYGHDVSPETPFPFVFCIEENTKITVPGTYFAQNETLEGNELKAAWLMKNYGNTTYTGLSYEETGIVVQNAIWGVTDQDMHLTGMYLTKAQEMMDAVPNITTLSYLTSSYVRMNLFKEFHDGKFTDPVQDQIRPVPIPGAAWLLGTGLIGLVGVRRRFQS